MSKLIRATIAAVLLLALSQTGALAAASSQSSSSGVTVVAVVSRSMQLSLPAPGFAGSAQSAVARSNAPVQLSADAGPSAVAASPQAAAPAVLYTVVSR